MESQINRWYTLHMQRLGGAIPEDITSKQIDESSMQAKARGLRTPDYQNLGQLISRYRQSMGISIEQLSQNSGICPEDILDLELSNLHRGRAVELVAKLKPILDIDNNEFKKVVLTSPVRK